MSEMRDGKSHSASAGTAAGHSDCCGKCRQTAGRPGSRKPAAPADYAADFLPPPSIEPRSGQVAPMALGAGSPAESPRYKNGFPLLMLLGFAAGAGIAVITAAVLSIGAPRAPVSPVWSTSSPLWAAWEHTRAT